MGRIAGVSKNVPRGGNVTAPTDEPLPRWVPWALYVGATLTLAGSGASAILADWDPALLDGTQPGTVDLLGVGVHGVCILVAVTGTALVSVAAFAILKKYFGPLGLSEEQAPRYIFATGLFMFLAGSIGTVSVAGLIRNGTLVLGSRKDEDLAVLVAQQHQAVTSPSPDVAPKDERSDAASPAGEAAYDAGPSPSGAADVGAAADAGATGDAGLSVDQRTGDAGLPAQAREQE